MFGLKQVTAWNAWFDAQDKKGKFYFYLYALLGPSLVLYGIKGGWLAILWMIALAVVRGLVAFNKE